LHCGWGVEGPIGSSYKLDCSYLSAHVNLSEAVQDATKHYKVPIIMSEAFYRIMSHRLQKECRRIDYILAAGHAKPFFIYTWDIVRTEDHKKKNKEARVRCDELMKDTSDLRLPHYAGRAPLVLKDVTLPLDDDFREQFRLGLEHYVSGTWTKSKTYFEAAAKIKDDGPTHALLGFMKEHDYTSPVDWKGYRDLE